MERKLERFSFAYATGTYIILATFLIVGCYCILDIQDNGFGPGIEFYKDNTVWTSIGFSIYVYEGIGVVMPIMKASAVPEKFSSLII